MDTYRCECGRAFLCVGTPDEATCEFCVIEMLTRMREQLGIRPGCDIADIAEPAMRTLLTIPF